MFKSGRWRSEKKKKKIKIVQVSELKSEGITISLGKPTGKAEKAMLLDGHCRWESPVYETVKFLQDVTTGKLNPRIYHLIVSTTKSGLVGETSIDFADYVDAINTCNVSLPLHNSISKAMLHVSIQRQLENVALQRVVKESDSLVKSSSSQDMKSQLSIEADESHKCDSHESQGRDPQVLLEETREELDYEKDLRIQLQKTQESNTELILAVQDLEAMLGQRRKRTVENNTEEQRRRSCTSETDEDEDQKALDELVKGHMDAKEAHVLERRIIDLYNEIEIHKRDKDDFEIQVDQLALDYEILKQENHDIFYKLEQSQVHEQLKMQYECSSSLVNVKELENQIESLEAKLKKQSEDFSKSLRRINELETHMEEELEKQAQTFEADIEAVTRDKVDQEKRAIEAEEALRKSRWKNSSVAGKIQDEFKRISEQMSFTFAANGKMTKKAMREAHDLHMQKRQLEELLMNANDELLSKKVEYEAKLNEMEKMLEGLVAKSKNLENEKRQQEDVNADLTQEITTLEDEIEILRLELEETRRSRTEVQASLQIRNTEKDELSSTIASMKKESDSLAEELQRIKDQKEAVVILLKSEVEIARSQCDDLKHSLSKNESESEKHRRRSNKERILLFEEHIKLKENALEVSSKMFIEKEKDLNNQIKELETKLNKLSPNSLETLESLHGQEEDIFLQNREVLSSNKSDNLKDLVNEVASLKEQNGVMEMELKEMQERYSEISVRFAEVEGERQRLVMTVRNLKNAKRS